MYDREPPCIALGTRIAYYHEKTGFNAPSLLRIFRRLPPEEVFALQAGDIAYVDTGSLRRGTYRVYGWMKGVITEARYVHAQRWKVSYQARRNKGCCYVELDGFCADISRPDEVELAQLIAAHPECLRI